MILSLVLALVGCGGTSEPPPPAAPVEVPAAAETVASTTVAPPAPARAFLVEAVVTTGAGIVTGVRVTETGEVEQGIGTPRSVAWRPVRTLPPLDLAILTDFLESRDIEDVPDALPVPPPLHGVAPTRATWTLHTSAGVRRIRSDAANAVRVPALDQLEQLLWSGYGAAPVHTRWALSGSADEPGVSHIVPCDPLRHPALLGVTRTLLDPGLDAATPSTAQGEPLVRLDWTAGTRAWQTRLHPDGVIVRVDEIGRTTAALLPHARIDSVQQALEQVRWEGVAAGCAGL